MTRQEEIENEAYRVSNNSDEFTSFVQGAEWADEHPNLHNDEKYQTVKVSQLDELNRKAKLYDEFVDKLHELVKVSWDCFESQINFDKYITERMIQSYKENL